MGGGAVGLLLGVLGGLYGRVGAVRFAGSVRRCQPDHPALGAHPAEAEWPVWRLLGERRVVGEEERGGDWGIGRELGEEMQGKSGRKGGRKGKERGSSVRGGCPGGGGVSRQWRKYGARAQGRSMCTDGFAHEWVYAGAGASSSRHRSSLGLKWPLRVPHRLPTSARLPHAYPHRCSPHSHITPTLHGSSLRPSLCSFCCDGPWCGTPRATRPHLPTHRFTSSSPVKAAPRPSSMPAGGRRVVRNPCMAHLHLPSAGPSYSAWHTHGRLARHKPRRGDFTR